MPLIWESSPPISSPTRWGSPATRPRPAGHGPVPGYPSARHQGGVPGRDDLPVQGRDHSPTPPALLDPAEAHAAEDKVLDRGAADPGQAARRHRPRGAGGRPRKRRSGGRPAAGEPRVERWIEDSGNAALMGCELPPDEVLAADQRITAWARELRPPDSMVIWICCAPAPTSIYCWARIPVPPLAPPSLRAPQPSPRPASPRPAAR